MLLATTAILAAAYLALIFYKGAGFDALGLLAVLMQYFEMALFIAFATFVSTFSSSLLSIVYTSAVFFLGHVVSSLVTDAQVVGVSGVKYFFIEVFYYIFPNLEKFDIRDIAIHVVATPWLSFGLAAAYAAAHSIKLE